MIMQHDLQCPWYKQTTTATQEVTQFYAFSFYKGRVFVFAFNNASAFTVTFSTCVFVFCNFFVVRPACENLYNAFTPPCFCKHQMFKFLLHIYPCTCVVIRSACHWTVPSFRLNRESYFFIGLYLPFFTFIIPHFFSVSICNIARIFLLNFMQKGEFFIM